MQAHSSLSGGDSIIVCWPANGNTIRLEADQRPGHPGNSHPQDNVELCGDSLFITGQITTVPEDDEDDFVETYCRMVTASYDPNDKQVNPEGLTNTDHYIDSNVVLEYVVHFQNTGTDTAFKVVIRDTLSPYLDITTIQPGAGSHPYTLDILGNNILQWTFDNILLPDSNVNEPESHGFMKYKIDQKPGNALGTVIENSAGIIFDFNTPVITNTVFNTVGNVDSMTCSITADFSASDSMLIISFINTSINATSYYWDFGDGATNTAQNPTHTYSADGLYTVTLTVSNGCGSTSTIQTINVQSTRLNQHTTDNIRLKVYPNPFRERTVFNYSIGKVSHVELIIHSYTGQYITTLVSQQQDKGSYTIDWHTADIAAGVYYYTLMVDGMEWVKKAIRIK